MQLRDLDAPFAYRNWVAEREKRPLLGIEEYPLFSDAYVIGELTCGPYQFINLVNPRVKCGDAQRTMVLRLSSHIEVGVSVEDMAKTRAGLYHGGAPVDEIVALASLALGVRLKAGDMSRDFNLREDPLGTPTAFGLRREPILLMGNSGLLIPNICGDLSPSPNLSEDLGPLSALPNLCPADATALIRAARLYQDSLWIAESEPSLAWVMLVSAVETAANRWKSEHATPLETLKVSNPELFELLENTGIENLPQRVADLIADKMQATRKFIDFCMHFRPSPPIKRPEHKLMQFNWEPNNLKKSLRVVYHHRSRALHDGRPFPAPMCNAPLTPFGKVPEEKPIGLARSSQNATWLAKDTPMLLHIYEYIVRQTLLVWWKSMIAES